MSTHKTIDKSLIGFLRDAVMASAWQSARFAGGTFQRVEPWKALRANTYCKSFVLANKVGKEIEMEIQIDFKRSSYCPVEIKVTEPLKMAPGWREKALWAGFCQSFLTGPTGQNGLDDLRFARRIYEESCPVGERQNYDSLLSHVLSHQAFRDGSFTFLIEDLGLDVRGYRLASSEANLLHYVALSDRAHDAMAKLIAAGVDLEAVNTAGRTPLLVAAKNENIENVKSLLLAGANLEAKDHEGNSALDYIEDDGLKHVIASFQSQKRAQEALALIGACDESLKFKPNGSA